MVSTWCDATATAKKAPKKRLVWTGTFASLALVLCLYGSTTVVESFQTTSSRTQPMSFRSSTTRNEHLRTQGGISRNQPLYLFGRNKDGEKGKSSSIHEGESGDRERKRDKIPFFGRLRRSKEEKSKDGKPKTQLQETAEAPKQQQHQEPKTPKLRLQKLPIAKEEQQQPIAAAAAPAELRPPKLKKGPSTADDLKLMAERARLEAERLDAELTLNKIEKLEQQLLRSKKDEGSDTSAVVEDLQQELDILQAKLKGEPLPIKKAASTAVLTKDPATATEASTGTTTTTTTTTTSGGEPVVKVAVERRKIEIPRASSFVEINDDEVLETAAIIAKYEPEVFSELLDAREEDFAMIPEFLIKVIAPFYGLKPESDGKIDREEFVRRLKLVNNLDYSFFPDKEPPTFDKAEIRGKKLQILQVDVESLRKMNVDSGTIGSTFDDATPTVTKKMIGRANGNATQLAIFCLEHDYYMFNSADEIISENIASMFQNSSYFGSMYPKCVSNRGENKGDDYVSEEPTEAQVDVLIKTILPAIKFSSSSKPQKVPGGYAIKGSHKFEDGDKLIEAIDKEIAKSRPNLNDQMTVLYTPSFGPLDNALIEQNSDQLNQLGSMDMSSLMEDPGVLELFADSEPILYITGPNIVREANRVGLTLTSIVGLATSWYLSVYPFLLNDKIASRIDGDLQLVESGFQPDLSYLTELSLPLFVCFMGIQLIHEAAHRLTAWSKDVKLSVPVFVPSLITGITSTVTTFKTLPKNKNDMFDISASGPLAGAFVSSMALAVGSKLTLISDPATLPELPLNIIRQSTLGGAIIDNIITGSLYVPEGAPTDGITIPLHPVAVAGFVGLIVNALALLPIGTTDGGRLTMALFDRAEKLSIGTLTLGALIFAGLYGSDLFLFYYSFCLAFQTGNEVPARNEMDSVDFSRIFVALVCYTLAILTLVPVK